MNKVLLICLILLLTLSACDQGEDNDTYDKHEGTIVSIEEKETEDDSFDGWYFMLVIPDIDDTDISDKDDDKLEEVAKDNDGAYYNVSPDIYDESDLETGTKVEVEFDEEAQAKSTPPVRDAESIHVDE